MPELLYEMIALDEAAQACIPLLESDPVLQKFGFNPKLLKLVDIEYDTQNHQKVVLLEPCGQIGDYISTVLRELLAEKGFDAWVRFSGHQNLGHQLQHHHPPLRP